MPNKMNKNTKLLLAFVAFVLFLLIFFFNSNVATASPPEADPTASARYLDRSTFENYSFILNTNVCYIERDLGVLKGPAIFPSITGSPGVLQVGCVVGSDGLLIEPESIGICHPTHMHEKGRDRGCDCSPGTCKVKLPMRIRVGFVNLWGTNDPISTECLMGFTGPEKFAGAAGCDGFHKAYGLDVTKNRAICASARSYSSLLLNERAACAGYEAWAGGADRDEDRRYREITYCYPQGSIIGATTYSMDHNNNEVPGGATADTVLEIPVGFVCSGYEWVHPGDFVGEDDMDLVRKRSAFPSCDLAGFFDRDLFGKKVPGVMTAIGCLPRTQTGIVATLLRVGLGVGGMIALITIIAGIIMASTSSDNPEQVKKGQKMAINGALGLLVIVLSTAIMIIFGLRILNIGDYGGGFLEVLLRTGEY